MPDNMSQLQNIWQIMTNQPSVNMPGTIVRIVSDKHVIEKARNVSDEPSEYGQVKRQEVCLLKLRLKYVRDQLSFIRQFMWWWGHSKQSNVFSCIYCGGGTLLLSLSWTRPWWHSSWTWWSWFWTDVSQVPCLHLRFEVDCWIRSWRVSSKPHFFGTKAVTIFTLFRHSCAWAS